MSGRPLAVRMISVADSDFSFGRPPKNRPVLEPPRLNPPSPVTSFSKTGKSHIFKNRGFQDFPTFPYLVERSTK
jgi:hypothetical protein